MLPDIPWYAMFMQFHIQTDSRRLITRTDLLFNLVDGIFRHKFRKLGHFIDVLRLATCDRLKRVCVLMSLEHVPDTDGVDVDTGIAERLQVIVLVTWIIPTIGNHDGRHLRDGIPAGSISLNTALLIKNVLRLKFMLSSNH